MKITSDGKLNDGGGWIVHIQNNIAPSAAAPVGPAPSAKEAMVG